MFYVQTFFYSKYLLELNIFFLFFSFFLICTLFFFNNFTAYLTNYKNSNIIKIIKIFLAWNMLISFFLFLISLFFYFLYIYYSYTNLFNTFFLLPNLFFFKNLYIFNFFFNNWIQLNFSIDIFGLLLLFLAYTVGFLSFLALDTRLYWKNLKYLGAFNIFILIVIFYTSTTNLIFFFLLYECLLLPSFLFVYFVSPSRRAVQASIYFVIWTQLGSFLVLCCVAYFISVFNVYSFEDLKFFQITELEYIFLYFFLFFGFGLKIPIWPCHYWLTKTHVEAPSGFSIYLSGFLVKSALYGFYKITTSINININTNLYIIICFFGVIDASLKMWSQTDLKKLVAYGTIQEMNLIYLVFCWGDSYLIIAGIIFTVTHAFLSAIMFFLVDCIYRRYHTRSLIEINGILHFTPNLAISILFMSFFFSGLPGTIKFCVEFYIFSGLLEVTPTNCFILMLIANTFGLIGFSKSWYNAIFGGRRDNFHTFPLDLTIKELFFFFFSFFFLFFFSFTTIFIF